jgi:prophage DNA circulation protein
MRALEEQILSQWADQSQTQAKIDGMTVYVARDFVCNKRAGVPTEAVTDALKACGLGSLVHPDYSSASLKAAIKDMRGENGDDGQVPESLKELLQWQELFRLRVRAS